MNLLPVILNTGCQVNWSTNIWWEKCLPRHTFQDLRKPLLCSPLLMLTIKAQTLLYFSKERCCLSILSQRWGSVISLLHPACTQTGSMCEAVHNAGLTCAPDYLGIQMFLAQRQKIGYTDKYSEKVLPQEATGNRCFGFSDNWFVLSWIITGNSLCAKCRPFMLSLGLWDLKPFQRRSQHWYALSNSLVEAVRVRNSQEKQTDQRRSA